jgi:hypothetical protein
MKLSGLVHRRGQIRQQRIDRIEGAELGDARGLECGG